MIGNLFCYYATADIDIYSIFMHSNRKDIKMQFSNPKINSIRNVHNFQKVDNIFK